MVAVNRIFALFHNKKQQQLQSKRPDALVLWLFCSTFSGESATKADEQALTQNVLFKFTRSKSIVCYSAHGNCTSQQSISDITIA